MHQRWDLRTLSRRSSNWPPRTCCPAMWSRHTLTTSSLRTREELSTVLVKSLMDRYIGLHDRAKVMEGLTVFEAKSVSTREKRKREDKGDPSDVDGYKGPWREYVGQVTVSKPTEEEMAAMELMFADRRRRRRKMKRSRPWRSLQWFTVCS